jgi:hypothetical protein
LAQRNVDRPVANLGPELGDEGHDMLDRLERRATVIGLGRYLVEQFKRFSQPSLDADYAVANLIDRADRPHAASFHSSRSAGQEEARVT